MGFIAMAGFGLIVDLGRSRKWKESGGEVFLARFTLALRASAPLFHARGV